VGRNLEVGFVMDMGDQVDVRRKSKGDAENAVESEEILREGRQDPG